MELLMANNAKDSFKAKWEAMPPKKRMIAVGGVVLVVVAILSIFMKAPTPTGPTGPVNIAASKAPVNCNLPGSNAKDMSIENVMAQLEATQRNLLEERKAREELQLKSEKNQASAI